MGLSASLLLPAFGFPSINTEKEDTDSMYSMLKTYSFKEEHLNKKAGFKRDAKMKLKTHVPLNNLVVEKEEKDSGEDGKCNEFSLKSKPSISCPEPYVYSSPRPVLDAAATKVQKVYKSYRTRRNLADCAVVVEELWWKALDFAALKRSSISFFNIDKQETAASRWSRARTRAAKVGKGLSKDEKAQKLALQHWLEAIDPRHRYGHNLHFYYDVWCASRSTQPFFYWLDVGDGKELSVKKCPRVDLQRHCIKYLGPKEREAYRVIVEEGKLVYKESGSLLNTEEGSKWIFVLSTARALYVGQKKKGAFQHSSFLSGGATTAAGRLVAHDGILEAIWPYSGHYLPTEDNFKEFISFLEEHNVDLTNVKVSSQLRKSHPPTFSKDWMLDLAFQASSQQFPNNQLLTWLVTGTILPPAHVSLNYTVFALRAITSSEGETLFSYILSHSLGARCWTWPSMPPPNNSLATNCWTWLITEPPPNNSLVTNYWTWLITEPPPNNSLVTNYWTWLITGPPLNNSPSPLPLR